MTWNVPQRNLGRSWLLFQAVEGGRGIDMMFVPNFVCRPLLCFPVSAAFLHEVGVRCFTLLVLIYRRVQCKWRIGFVPVRFIGSTARAVLIVAGK